MTLRTVLITTIATISILGCNTLRGEDTDGAHVFEAFSKQLLGGSWETTGPDGQKVTHTYSRAGGDNFLRNEMKGGPVPGTAIVGVAPSSGKCTWWGFQSNGTILECTIAPDEDNTWIMSSISEGANQYKGRVRFVDDQTIHEETIKMVVNGEELPAGSFQWKRVFKEKRSNSMPEELRYRIDKDLIGEWTVEGRWGDETFNGEETIRWDSSKTAVIIEGFEAKDGETVNYVTMVGWDAGPKQLSYKGYSSNGETWNGQWTKTEGRKWSGFGGGIYDGVKWKSKTQMRLSGNTRRYEDVTDGEKWIAEYTRKQDNADK